MITDTTALMQQLSAEVNARIQEIRDSPEFANVFQQLSALPAHPYDQLKHVHFGPDYEFPTFDSIELPSADFDIRTSIPTLTGISNKIDQLSVQTANDLQQRLATALLTSIKGVDCFDDLDLNKALNAEAVHAPDEMVKSSIIFSEFVKTIPVDLIETDPYTIAKKINYFYTKTFSHILG